MKEGEKVDLLRVFVCHFSLSLRGGQKKKRRKFVPVHSKTLSFPTFLAEEGAKKLLAAIIEGFLRVAS